jgi:hypothetical protein
MDRLVKEKPLIGWNLLQTLAPRCDDPAVRLAAAQNTGPGRLASERATPSEPNHMVG